MKRRIIIFLGVVAVIVPIVFYAGWVSAAGPENQGLKLSTWLEKLDPSQPSEEQVKAQEAIRAIGTNCIPHLIRLLQREDSRLAEFCLWFNRRQSFLRLGVTPAEVHQQRALAAFRALGQSVNPFVPQIAALLANPSTAKAALNALSNGGEAAVPGFTQALTNVNPEVRSRAAHELGYRRTGDGTVELLIETLNDEHPEVRSAAAYALIRFSADHELIIPALIETLEDPDAGVRSMAAQALGEFGDRASNALPKLQFLYRNRSGLTAVPGAISKISPDEARELGIPAMIQAEDFERLLAIA